MAKLSLYMNPAGKVAVHRSGFSWLAFLALPLWALHRRLYLAFVLLLPLTFLLHVLVAGLLQLLPNENAVGLLFLAWLLVWSVLAGRRANAAHRWVLRRRGFFMTATELPPAAVAP